MRTWIEEWKIELAAADEQDLFAQKTRLVGAECALQTKVTKKAQNDQRIATDNVSKATLKLKDLRRTESLSRDSRFFPENYSMEMVSGGGKRVVYPMRCHVLIL